MYYLPGLEKGYAARLPDEAAKKDSANFAVLPTIKQAPLNTGAQI